MGYTCIAAVGHYGSVSGSSSSPFISGTFLPCGAGKYNSLTGQTTSTACVSCPANTFSMYYGMSSCAVCPSGYSSVAGSSSCTANARRLRGSEEESLE
jgi:hypothetical protein